MKLTTMTVRNFRNVCLEKRKYIIKKFLGEGCLGGVVAPKWALMHPTDKSRGETKISFITSKSRKHLG